MSFGKPSPIGGIASGKLIADKSRFQLYVPRPKRGMGASPQQCGHSSSIDTLVAIIRTKQAKEPLINAAARS